MCESIVQIRTPDGHFEKLADDILIVRQEGTIVSLYGLFTDPIRFKGTIQEIDSIKHTVTLSAAEVYQNDSEP